MTDNAALHAWTAFVTSLIKHPEAKTFHAKDAGAALSWASALPAPAGQSA